MADSIAGAWLMKLLDMGDGTRAPVVIARPPDALLTGVGSVPAQRLRVDVAQTSFFDGREFRSFRRLQLTASQVYTVRIVVPVNTILWGFDVSLASGDLRVETLSGATSGGTWGDVLPILPANAMTDRPTPVYTPQVTMAGGGTITGGTVIDEAHIKTDANTNRAATVGVSQGDERGVAPATYHWRFTATEASDAIMHVRWEERP